MHDSHLGKFILLILSCYFLSTAAYSSSSLIYRNNLTWASFWYQVIDVEYKMNLNTPEERDYYLRFYPSKVRYQTGTTACKVMCEVNDYMSYIDMVHNSSRSVRECSSFKAFVSPYPHGLYTCTIQKDKIVWAFYNNIQAQGNSMTFTS